MKKFYLISLFIFGSLVLNAQFLDQKGFSFQGYARDADGAALGNQTIQVKFTVYPDGNESQVDYTETHSLSTDAYGIFTAVVGSKSIASFGKLPFSRVNYWLKVEVKTTSADWSTINSMELLSVPYARAAGNGMPAGSVIAFAGAKSKIPAGYLVCDGTSYNTTDYPELYNAIGNAWGGSGSSFRVPDMRGLFLRGVDDNANRDSDKNSRTSINSGGNTGNNVGSYQPDMYESHDHTGTTSSSGAHNHDVPVENGGSSWDTDSGRPVAAFNSSVKTSSDGAHSHSFTSNSSGGAETRPQNVGVYYIIKY